MKIMPGEFKRVSAWLGGLDLSHDAYADRFFQALGAENISSIDASSYEDATIIHNFNEPIPSELHSRFSCVIDGGTIEHIFDIKRSIENCMHLVAPGGHLIFCQGANNLMGHGFYQFSPEFFHAVLIPENGFRVLSLLLYENGVWYDPSVPGLINERVEAITSHQTYIFVVAERISETVPFQKTPHQSDYVANLSGSAHNSQISAHKYPLLSKQSLKQLFPVVLKLKRHWIDFKKSRIFPAMPFLQDWEKIAGEKRYLKKCSLSNSRRFRRIGKKLF